MTSPNTVLTFADLGALTAFFRHTQPDQRGYPNAVFAQVLFDTIPTVAKATLKVDYEGINDIDGFSMQPSHENTSWCLAEPRISRWA